MLGQQRFEIHIAYPVAVGQHKGFLSNVLPHALDPPAGLGIQPRIHQRHPPGLRHILMNRHLIFRGKIKGYIGSVKVIVREILLDDMSLIAAADHKIVEPEAGIILHDMPQNRLFSNGNHGLGFQMTLLADAGAQAAGQDYNLHASPPSIKWATF